MAHWRPRTVPTPFISRNLIYLTADKSMHWRTSHVHSAFIFSYLCWTQCAPTTDILDSLLMFTIGGGLHLHASCLWNPTSTSALWEQAVFHMLLVSNHFVWPAVTSNSMWQKDVQSFLRKISTFLEVLPVLRPWAIKPHPDSTAPPKLQLRP